MLSRTIKLSIQYNNLPSYYCKFPILKKKPLLFGHLAKSSASDVIDGKQCIVQTGFSSVVTTRKMTNV